MEPNNQPEPSRRLIEGTFRLTVGRDGNDLLALVGPTSPAFREWIEKHYCNDRLAAFRSAGSGNGQEHAYLTLCPEVLPNGGR